MEDRDFNELDLRKMLQQAQSYKPDTIEYRWIISAKHQNHQWEIIVEPDLYQKTLVVITAYPVWN